MNPQFEDEKPVNPFDLWTGANFKLKIRNVEGYRNYDKSEFDTSAPLLNDDDKLEQVWKSQYALGEFIEADNFKSYDELKAKLYRVLALNEGGQESAQMVEAPASPAPAIPTSSADADIPLTSSSDDDDESLSFFQNLAKS